jgi:DNA-directed RNA polymerase subunit RPC12/RpoP
MANENNEDLPKPIFIKNLGMMYATKNSKEKRRFGLYKCGFCGTEFKANTNSINNGNTKSCGCYNKRRVKETNTKHGLMYTKLYRAWADIKNRTLNPKHKHYNDYGGRGITICDEWKDDVKSFYDWAMSNGYEEDKGLSIDRIDNDGNYCPENCRWTTKTIQARNQRIRKNNTSGYRGVTFHKRDKKFTAYITVDKNNIHLGSFQTKEEGAIAYNNYIIENNLEGFILNEIPEECLI